MEQWLNIDEAKQRAALITAVVSGTWFYRELLPIDAFSGEFDPIISDWLAHTIQQLATGSLEVGKAN